MFIFIISIAAFIALEVFALAYGHSYQHWAKVIGKTLPDPTRLITNYTYGILSIFIPFTVWVLLMWQVGERYSLLTVFTVMWVFIGAGGASVKLLYWHDAKVAERQRMLTELEVSKTQVKQKDGDGQTARL